MKRISDKQYLLTALRVIEEISMDPNGFDDKENLYECMGKIYEISHMARNPSCASAHPRWDEPIKSAIRAEAKSHEGIR